jgi:glycosyltransferase involved in cell wall biosynthesis
MKISAIMAVKNGEKYLEEAILSVLNQTWPDLEFIIVNDASTDSTKEIIKRFAKLDSRIILIDNTINQGQGGSFNRALASSTGDVISFIDADDIWYPSKLDRVVRAFRDNQQLSLFQHNLELYSDRTPTRQLRDNSFVIGNLGGEFGDIVGEIPKFAPTSALSFRSKLLSYVLPIPSKRFRISADGYLTRTSIYFGSLDSDMNPFGVYRLHSANLFANQSSEDIRIYVEGTLKPALNWFYAKKYINSYYTPNVISPILDLNLEFFRLLVSQNRPLSRLVIVGAVPVGKVYDFSASICKLLEPSSVGVLINEKMVESLKDLNVECFCFQNSPETGRLHELTKEVVGRVSDFLPDLIVMLYYGNLKDFTNVINALSPLIGRFKTVAMNDRGGLRFLESNGYIVPSIKPEAENLKVRLASRNRRRILFFKDRFKKARCVIVANGPSLSISTLECLAQFTSFASNKIFLAFKNTTWRPTFYCISDTLVAKQNRFEIHECIKGVTFVSQKCRRYLKDSIYLISIPHEPFDRANVLHSPDPSNGMSCGHSVVVMQLRLAYWMGFEEVFIIGLDHRYEYNESDKVSGMIEMGNQVLRSQGETNHFTSDYSKKGELWTVPQLERIEKEFNQLDLLYSRTGRRIYNATQGSNFVGFQNITVEGMISRLR